VLWRVVLDSMVWAQAAANPDGPAGQVLELARNGKLRLIASAYIREEVLDALRDPHFKRVLSHDFDAEGWLDTTLVAAADVVEATGPAVLLDHAKDDPILWVAAAGDASHLVTWERKLLNLKHHRFTQIVTPPDFLRTWRAPRVGEPVAAWEAMRRATARVGPPIFGGGRRGRTKAGHRPSSQSFWRSW
jgi:predicted nucleic acid-binding protein